MKSVQIFSRALQFAFGIVIGIVTVLFAQIVRADTVINFDFNSTSELTERFNADSSTYTFAGTLNGLGNSGYINSEGGTTSTDIWTSSTGFSFENDGDSYSVSAYFHTTNQSGFSGLGFAIDEVNEPVGPTTGFVMPSIGYSTTDDTLTLRTTASNGTTDYDFSLNAPNNLFDDTWYFVKLVMVAQNDNTFDVTIFVGNSDADGNVDNNSDGVPDSVLASFTQEGIVNTDLSAAARLHPYVAVTSGSGARFDRIDNFGVHVIGTPLLISDINNDNDDDGQLDINDSDDDDDGTPDVSDVFPLDNTETGDNDKDAIGDNADFDDDNDGTPDSQDYTPFGESEPVDTDNDGVFDLDDEFPEDGSESVDSDGDGVGDNADAFDDDPNETTDTDGDGVGDNADAFDNDPNETTDTDEDGVGDNTDAFVNDPNETTDTDGDGVGDNADAFDNDPNETTDTDGDGVGDNTDTFDNDPNETTDSDGDGVGDNADAFDNDPNETSDTDGDGVGDNADAFDNDPNETTDSDEDGVGDNADAFVNDPSETTDSDGDGVGDNADAFDNDPNETTDSDGDGVGDNADAFDNDPNETTDTDGDGVGDNADAFDNDPNETTDSDGDGVGDNADAFDNDPNETTDSDEDGVGDNTDAFDNDPSETTDTDGDGVGDNADAFDNDPGETTDTDEDGIGDNADAFDNDPNETTDTDGDGVGDNADAFDNDPGETTDTDGDGVGDNADAFDNDASETTDTDEDGVGDNADAFDNDPGETTDTDGDGVGDNADAFDNDASETTDTDEDGVGDNADAFDNDPSEKTDTDGDGVGDNADAFDNDPNETTDTDGDGVGDNADAFDNDPNETTDTDEDGIGNNADNDDDNDGYIDSIESQFNTDSTDPASLPTSLDVDRDTLADVVERGRDTDNDGIGDEFDVDSDNDGIFDILEASAIPADAALLDTDFDGMMDDTALVGLTSVADATDTDEDGTPDYLDLDSDNDGLFDSVEVGVVLEDYTTINQLQSDLSARVLADPDADGLQNFRDLDSDNDGIPDIVEAGGLDEDNDGIIDDFQDDNSDGVDDGLLIAPLAAIDSDADGAPDYIDLDSNDNGIFDIVEAGLGAADIDGNGTYDVEPPLSEAVATTSVSGGGCSIAGPGGQPDMTLTALLVLSMVYVILIHAGTFRTIKCTFLVLLCSSLAVGPTLADVRTGLYLGIGGGVSRLMPGISYATIDDRDSVGNAWHTVAGYQLGKALGLELEYANLGTTNIDPVGSIDYKDINVSGLYHLGGAAHAQNGKKYSLYGRLGLGTIRNRSNINLERGSAAHWLAGAGIQVPINKNLSLRAEAVNYDSDASRAGLSVMYKLGKLPSYFASLFARNANNEPATQDRIHTASSTADRTASQSDAGKLDYVPLVLGADHHMPYQVRAKSVEKLMNTMPAPRVSWLITKNARQRIESRKKLQAIQENNPMPAAALPDNTDTPDSREEFAPVLYAFDSDKVSSEYQRKLLPLADFLRSNPEQSVTLTGHTDNVGTEEYNMQLSLRRAEAVRLFLLQQGIDRDMIRILGAGEKRPVRSNTNASGRKANRRVNIVMD